MATSSASLAPGVRQMCAPTGGPDEARSAPVYGRTAGGSRPDRFEGSIPPRKPRRCAAPHRSVPPIVAHANPPRPMPVTHGQQTRRRTRPGRSTPSALPASSAADQCRPRPAGPAVACPRTSPQMVGGLRPGSNELQSFAGAPSRASGARCQFARHRHATPRLRRPTFPADVWPQNEYALCSKPLSSWMTVIPVSPLDARVPQVQGTRATAHRRAVSPGSGPSPIRRGCYFTSSGQILFSSPRRNVSTSRPVRAVVPGTRFPRLVESSDVE